MLDLQKFIAGLHDYIGKALQPLSVRIQAVESRVPERGEKGERGERGEAGEKGERGPAGDSIKGDRGEDGKSIAVDDVLPSLQAELRKAIESIPAPQKGDRGDPGPAGESIKGDPGPDGKSVTLEDVLPALRVELDTAIKAIPIPKDGRDGADGKSVTAGEVLPTLTSELRKAIESLPVPKDGRDGLNGKDGTSVTVADLRGMFEAEQAKWALDFERRAQDQLQRAIDRMPSPKDGINGKDGQDGFGFDNVDVIHDGERDFTLRFSQGERVKDFKFRVPAILERGVHRAGVQYQKGDGVTFQGSYWIALKDTNEKPGDGNTDWRLSVKKGRDGRDGARGERGEPGKNARDLSGALIR